MNLEHMRRLCGWHFSVLGAGVLEGYEFGPDGRGYTNIRPRSGSHVCGVLYDLDKYSLDALDDFEGYPNVFNRVEVEIVVEDGEKHKAWVYVEEANLFNGDFIKEDYLKRVIIGARENRLPAEWVSMLEGLLKIARP